MAVSGAQIAKVVQRDWFDGLMFWGVQYRRVALWKLLHGSWGFALGAGAVGALALPMLSMVKGGAGLHALLGWLTLIHLLARGWVERRLPDPSFANDLRTGNFEQLRLTPHTAHTLLIQRGLPDLMFRTATMCLWLPLYALMARALGLGLLDGLALWLLFGFANYFVLGLVSIALLASAWEGTQQLLSIGLLSYAFLLDGGRTRTAVSSSGLFSVMIALPILGRVFLPDHLIVALPDLRGFALLWLLIELLRFERMARWLSAPSGFWRGMFLLPCAGLIAYCGQAGWQYGVLQAGVGAEATHSAALGMFLGAGYLNLLLVAVRRQAEPIVQPLRAHLLETGLLRLLSVLLIGIAIALWSLPTGTGVFWGVLVWLSLIEWLGSALVRRGMQQAHSRAPAWSYTALLLGATPALVFLATRHPAIGAFSNCFALLMASDAWRMTGVAAQPALWLCLLLPGVRYALTLGMLMLGARLGRATQSAPRRAAVLNWLALPLVYPLLDWWAQRQAHNPITRLTLAERQPPFALLIGLSAFILSVFANANFLLLAIVPLGVFLWLWGYHTTARRVRRWLDSGELTSAFLAGLQPAQLFWGWVYGAWVQQLRVLVAAVVGAFLGAWLQTIFGMRMLGGVGGPGVALVLMGMQVSLVGVTLAMWSCAWLIAAPSAVRDQLALPSRAAPLLTPRAAVLAAFYTLFACCAPLAPFLLIGLPIYASQSAIALHRLARAPDESKRTA